MSDGVRQVVTGSLAGLAATAPMTVFMEAAFPALPEREQYPLPPRQVTARVGERAGVWHEMSESGRKAATLAAHFGYGAAAGALYGLVAPALPLPPALRGAGYGLTVWAGSYLGLLPAAGLFPPAPQEPAGRNALMIAAHLVWGLALGLLTGDPAGDDRAAPGSGALAGAEAHRRDPVNRGRAATGRDGISCQSSPSSRGSVPG